jgi:peptidoglycan hydrolase-like protein with peptidoglycan-binding domain
MMRGTGFLSGTRVVLPLCAGLSLLVGANMFVMQGRKTGLASATVDAPATAAARVQPAKVAPAAPTAAPRRPAKQDAIAQLLASEAAEAETAPAQAADGPALSPEKVVTLQQKLNDAGYQTGPASGTADLMTRGAILAYEADHGLPLTAEPNEAVLEGLVLGNPPASRRVPASTPPGRRAAGMIRTTQVMLRKLGYRVEETGRMDDATTRAIRQFESASALAPSGRVSGVLVAELSRATATRHTVASD